MSASEIAVVVADTGPLVALSRIDKLELLPAVLSRVIVPLPVLEELQLAVPRPGIEALRRAVDDASWLIPETPPPFVAGAGLGAGEAAAIALALQHGLPLLIDDARGRTVARNRGLLVLGTGRILLAAKEHGLIASVGGVIRHLTMAGYRLSPTLRKQLRLLAGETASAN